MIDSYLFYDWWLYCLCIWPNIPPAKRLTDWQWIGKFRVVVVKYIWLTAIFFMNGD